MGLRKQDRPEGWWQPAFDIPPALTPSSLSCQPGLLSSASNSGGPSGKRRRTRAALPELHRIVGPWAALLRDRGVIRRVSSPVPSMGDGDTHATSWSHTTPRAHRQSASLRMAWHGLGREFRHSTKAGTRSRQACLRLARRAASNLKLVVGCMMAGMNCRAPRKHGEVVDADSSSPGW